MAHLIAGTYEIHEKIGAGGSGVVYRGVHRRLGKEVVLKADRRSLSASPETLRREVDALKDLSHTYIPQVYDYLEEDDVVYTVMDYIDGESLDRALKRKERFPQQQIIAWACQLLEALVYLHSRPPHGILHGDIKPANIMQTAEHDIRLIDFNIALALGEKGSVCAGYSIGYASPEHYETEAYELTASVSHPPSRPSASAPGRGERTEALPGAGAGAGMQTEALPGAGAREGMHTEALPGAGAGEGMQTEALPGAGAGDGMQTEALPGAGAGKGMQTRAPSRAGTGAGMQTETLPDTGEEVHTEALPGMATPSAGRASASAASGARTAGRRYKMMDVRSDIYSLGATLYHLLTGQRPARHAEDVRPITLPEVSPMVAQIIQKAMDPDPARRYQTAQEMLDAFEHIRENDPRTRRHAHRKRVTAGLLAGLFLVGGVCTFTGLRQQERAQALAKAAAEQAEQVQRLEKETLAAVTGSEDAYRNGNAPEAVRLAAEALSRDTPYTARARYALTYALGVYDFFGYMPYRRLALPSEPFKALLSPEGTRAAAMTSGKLLLFDTESGETLAELAAAPSALADVVFLDENVILYAGAEGICAYDIASGSVLWTGAAVDEITLSADGSTAAAAGQAEVFLYRTSDGTLLQTVSFQGKDRQTPGGGAFADTDRHMFSLNRDGSLLAMSFSDGSVYMYDLRNRQGDLRFFGASEFLRFEGGFYGSYFAFAAFERELGQNTFTIFDTETREQTGGFKNYDTYHVQADESGIWISQENLLVGIHPVTGERWEAAYTDASIVAFSTDGEYTIAATKDGGISIFDGAANWVDSYVDDGINDFVCLAGDYALSGNRSVPALRLRKLKTPDAPPLFTYDSYDLHDEARVSADGQTVMLFQYDGFRVYGKDGLLADIELPEPELVYNQLFRREGEDSFLEVMYQDGTTRQYSAANGQLISEFQGTPATVPEEEEFLTDRLRIVSPLHGTPIAYDRETGELVRELEPDDILTYVEQMGEYIITQYMTTQFEPYGLLLNEDCETLAFLPWLCDVMEDGVLIFDDQMGTIRQSRIYSIEELLAMAGNEKKEETTNE